MSQRILDLKVNLNYTVPVIFVIEAVEEHWQKIYELSNDIISSLLGRVNELYFLGNSRSYPIVLPQDFIEQSPAWFNENKNRVSLLNPVFEEIEKKKFKGMIVVFCSKEPCDLEDWLESEILERTLFVMLSDEDFPLKYNLNYVEGIKGATYILSKIENPPEQAWIEAKGFVPLCYEIKQGGKAEVKFQDGKFLFSIIPEGERLEIHLKVISDDFPVLYLKRRKGQIESNEIKEELPWFKDPTWEEIPEDLKPIVEAGITKSSYKCNQCGEEHSYRVLICPEGGIVLRGIPMNSCVLFTKEKYFPLSEWYALPLRHNQRVITRDGDLYEWRNGNWVYLRKIDIYEKVDDEVWALFHRI